MLCIIGKLYSGRKISTVKKNVPNKKNCLFKYLQRGNNYSYRAANTFEYKIKAKYALLFTNKKNFFLYYTI